MSAVNTWFTCICKDFPHAPKISNITKISTVIIFSEYSIISFTDSNAFIPFPE